MKSIAAILCRSASAASLVPRAGLLASVLASAVLISACGGGGDSSSTTPTPTPSTAPTLSFASASKQATLGDADFTQAVSAVCSAQSGYAPSISYSSSAPAVASVDASGKVSLKTAGNAVISANVAEQGTCSAGSQSYALTVNKARPSISFVNPTTDASLVQTKTIANPATVAAPANNGSSPLPAVSGLAVSYASDNTAVATVSNQGTITLVRTGTAVITATVQGDANYLGSITASYTLTVVSERYALVAKAGGGTYDKTECVKDGSTGRIWEGKPASGNRGDLDTQGKYTNYDSSASGNKQKPGETDATPANVNATTNSIGYVNAVNAASLCGYNDWRMPTKDELQAIVDASVTSGPKIDAAWFPNTQSGDDYWTSSPFAGNPNGAWNVFFDDGYVYYGNRGIGYYVRLVR